MTEIIAYELHLPANRTGEKLAKSIQRILKHTYQGKRVRIQHSKDTLVISAQVHRIHLGAIRQTVQLTLRSRGIEGELRNDAIYEQSAAEGNGHRGASPERALQEKSRPAEDESPAAA